MSETKQDTEQKILETAERLFLEQGFKATTTSQIAKECGYNQALVHYYYRTKEKLFECIWKEKIKFMVDNLMDLSVSYNSVEEFVVNIINTHWAFMMKNSRLISFVLREFLNNSQFMYELVTKEMQKNLPIVLSSVESILGKEICEGKINPISTENLLLTIISLDASPFVIYPLFKDKAEWDNETIKAEVENRKQEIITTVLARLKNNKPTD